MVDDANTADDTACEATPATQFIAISNQPANSVPVIFLSHEDGAADYRIFVRSRHFSTREAAALIVGAHGQTPRLTDAAL